MSPEWQDLVKFSIAEASRCHLEMSMEGCDGWSESGGPWVQPSESMQKVVWTVTLVQGGTKVDLTHLAQPEQRNGFYQDIAVYALPVSDAGSNLKDLTLTTSDPAAKLDPVTLDSGSAMDSMSLAPGQPAWIQANFSGPVKVGSVRLGMDIRGTGRLRWDILGGTDADHLEKIRDIGCTDTAAFAPPPGARCFRISLAKVPDGLTTLKARLLSFGPRVIDQLAARIGIAVDQKVKNFQDAGDLDSQKIDPSQVVNLTGQETWTAPPGVWHILRLGHTSTGMSTHPSTMAGLECNKLSAVAVSHHIENMFGPIIQGSPDKIGHSFNYILLDSWEAGCENWTDDLPKEFQQRRGYDLTRWLPALTGEIIGSAEQTQRFLWDYRRTLADLLAEKHYGTIQDWAHQHHMNLTAEATGIGMPTVADQLLCKKFTDIPMGEFWVGQGREGVVNDPKEAASAAHIYGKPLAATESFTASTKVAAWTNDPAGLKALGDEEYCLGINRFVFHRYAHQPWLDRVPGMSMGPWGINFERTNTWWKPGAAWIKYLTRCQYLLQQGQFQADLLYFYGEGVPVCVNHGALTPPPPPGYDYDVCNADILLHHAHVEQGAVVLDSGMTYRALVLPPEDRMTLPVLKKLSELVKAGATVYGPKPLHSPSLSGYPAAEDELHQLAESVWGDCDGAHVKEHRYGEGKITLGASLDKVLAVPSDFAHDAGDLLYIHRRVGTSEIYFVSNQEAKDVTPTCTFRVQGKLPELWRPDTGAIETLACYTSADGQTAVPIHFDPTGSVFVVFRQASSTFKPVKTLTRDGLPVWPPKDGPPQISTPVRDGDLLSFVAMAGGSYVADGPDSHITVKVATPPAPLTLDGPWAITFPPKLGAPDSATFDHLMSWTESTTDGIKYFSGTAAYQKHFHIESDVMGKDLRIYLDLGAVKNLATVTLNGQSFGVLWKPPFQIDVTPAVRTGDNLLNIEVTNLWPNRLIGDSKLPENQRITWASVDLYKPDSPLLPSGLLGPVKLTFGKSMTVGVSQAR